MVHLLYDLERYFLNINELRENIGLNEFIDVAGRETNAQSNTLLYYIYKDETVKKVYQIE